MLRPLFITLFTLLIGKMSLAQIRITNPDFSLHSDCPKHFSQIDLATDWYRPTGGTSDYYNACGNFNFGVPSNFFGYQKSESNAYAGLYASLDGSDYKEYIATTVEPLQIGTAYNITILVSLANKSDIGTDGLGIYFSTTRINEPSSFTYPVIPQIDFSNYGAITDTMNWVTLTGNFVADSAYTNLMIGCFKEFSKLNKVHLGSGSWVSSYYYIGGVILEERKDTIVNHNLVFPNAFTPNDDGKNDVFRIIGTDLWQLEDYSLNVYDRWGVRIFYTGNVYNGWDGWFNNMLQDGGTYFYMSRFTLNGTRQILKGDVTLIR